MLLSNKKIAIIGGGPGGLTLARLLQTKGAHVNVFERDVNRNVRQQGATLDLHEESGLKALSVAGLMDEFKKYYRPGADNMRIADQHANVIFDDHEVTDRKEFGHEHFRPEIDRGPLRDLLIDSLLENTIVWDSHYLAMEKENEGWRIHFKNGTSAYADIVVAADGASSKIRPLITDITPVYSGVCVVEGNIYHADKNAPQLSALLKGGKVFAFGNEQSIILSSKGDGSLSFYTGCREEAEWVKKCGINFADKNEVKEWFTERFSMWSPVWQELFASNELYIIPRTMYHFPTDQQWEALPNLTMLGDAAHLMPPYAGEGVNMAMLDALELFENLTREDHATIHEAIANYESNMRARASEITQLTLDQTALLHSSAALGHMLSLFQQQEP
jgi:2-polyprenyl-6-methoxyphenol hydroxylase-like FAD-dependent oxidoreductase